MTDYTELEQLLDENYYKLDSYTCRDQVLQFVHENETMRDHHYEFTKKLTKVGFLMIKEKSFPEDLMERLYQYHFDGIRAVPKPTKAKSHARKIRRKIKSHFYYHAGDLAKLIFEQTQIFEWIDYAIYCYYKSQNSSEPYATSMALFDAGKAILLREKSISHPDHFPQASQSFFESGCLNTNLRHKSYAFYKAGQCAQKVLDKKWLLKAYRMYRLASSKAQGRLKRQSLNATIKILRKWYKQSRCTHILKEALYLNNEQTTATNSPNVFYYAHRNGAYMSRELFITTKNPYYLAQESFHLRHAIHYAPIQKVREEMTYKFLQVEEEIVLRTW